MADNKKKWLKFGFGASPTLFFLLIAFTQPRLDAGVTILVASILYLIIGLIIAAEMGKENPQKSAFTAGVISGFFASFILSATLCFS